MNKMQPAPDDDRFRIASIINPHQQLFSLTGFLKISRRVFWRAAFGFSILLMSLIAPETSSAAGFVQTLAATTITSTSAVLNASVNPGGIATSVSFEIGPTTNYGTTTFSTPIGSGSVTFTFTHLQTGLTPGATYHYRIVASSSAGVTNGDDISFVASASTVFSLASIALPPVGHGAIAWGDFDGDGKLDLLVTGENASFNNISQVWRNTGNNVFANVNASIAGVSSSAVAVGDMYNDGNQDIMLSGFAGVDGQGFPVRVTKLYRNLGGGSFSEVTTSLPGLDTGSISLGDMDNDGRLDVLLTGFGDSGAVAQVWHNQGNGTFANLNVPLSGVFYSSTAWGDFDGDGNQDFVIAGTTTDLNNDSICQVWRNLGNGTFANINANLPGVSQGAVAWGDFDGDGKLDLVITGFASNGPIAQIWRNLGNGTFANVNAGLTGVSESSVAVADFDNDGKLDIAITGVDANSNFVAQIWRNLGNNVFTNMSTGFTGLSFGTATWVDTDNDGRLDLVITGYDTNVNPVLALYHNNSPLANTNALRLGGVSKLANGFSHLKFNAPAGFSYRVQASSDMAHWTALGSSVATSSGTQEYNEVSTTNTARFYRVSNP
jgi:hypothetical protein